MVSAPVDERPAAAQAVGATAVTAACVAFAVAIALAGLLEPPRRWFAFRGATDLPIFAAALAAATVALALSARARSLAVDLVRRVASLPRWFTLPVLAAILLVARNRNRLLGDTDLLLRQVGDGSLTISVSEPLDVLVHAVLHRLTTLVHDSDQATIAYVGLSVVAGLVYVHLPSRLAATLDLGRWGRALVTTALLTVASIQLFFGYVESYTLPSVVLVASMTAALVALRDDSSLLPAAALLGLAVALHPQTLFAVPALAAARWWQRRPDRALDVARIAGLTMAPVVALWVAIALAPTTPRFGGKADALLVPLRAADGPKEHFTMFSEDHAVAVANELLLLAPVPLLLLAVVAVARRARRVTPVTLSPAERYLALASLGGLLLLVLVHPDRGPAADWDLFATTAFPAAALGASVVGRRLPEAVLERLVPVAGAAALTMTATFVVANAAIVRP
jgi:hypothetical protein